MSPGTGYLEDSFSIQGLFCSGELRRASTVLLRLTMQGWSGRKWLSGTPSEGPGAPGRGPWEHRALSGLHLGPQRTDLTTELTQMTRLHRNL